MVKLLSFFIFNNIFVNKFYSLVAPKKKYDKHLCSLRLQSEFQNTKTEKKSYLIHEVLSNFQAND